LLSHFLTLKTQGQIATQFCFNLNTNQGAVACHSQVENLITAKEFVTPCIIVAVLRPTTR